MCGGFALSAAGKGSSLISYHFGRLLGYLLLGAFAGYLGKSFLGQEMSQIISRVAAVFMTACFLFLGYRVWTKKPLHFSFLPRHALLRIFKFTGRSPGLTGLASALLPCGWLHSFILGALATESALLGAGFMFCFWLGTLPALSFAPWLLGNFGRSVLIRAPRAAGAILVALGLFNLGIRLPALLKTNGDLTTSHCHTEQAKR